MSEKPSTNRFGLGGGGGNEYTKSKDTSLTVQSFGSGSSLPNMVTWQIVRSNHVVVQLALLIPSSSLELPTPFESSYPSGRQRPSLPRCRQ